MRTVRLDELATAEGLSATERVHYLAEAMEWLAMAQSLVMFHGPRRAAERLEQAGCPIRFDAEGEAVVIVKESA